MLLYKTVIRDQAGSATVVEPYHPSIFVDLYLVNWRSELKTVSKCNDAQVKLYRSWKFQAN